MCNVHTPNRKHRNSNNIENFQFYRTNKGSSVNARICQNTGMPVFCTPPPPPNQIRATVTLIFLANILCVHVRKSDEMYASPMWCSYAKKKKNATEVTVRTCLAFDFHRAGATHVLTVCSCQRILNRLTSSPFFFFVVNVTCMHFLG